VDIVPVVTIVNGVNNEQVGRIIEFALDNPKTINFLVPAGVVHRAATEITDERRHAQRYTLSHLARREESDRHRRAGRDWFPISFMGSFTDWADVTTAPKEFGQLTCGCHPNCGVGMAIMIDKETKEAVPVTAFLKAEQLAKDVAAVSDARTRPLPVGGRHGARAGAQLRFVQIADSLQAHGPAQEVRQDVRRHRQRREGKPARSKAIGRKRTSPSAARTAGTSCSSRACGSRICSTTISPHRDVHHPVCHAAGRNLLLRVQHGRRLAQHHRRCT
jgi:hypothetical protein